MLIDLKNVFKTYRTTDVETQALADVSIGITKGEYVAIEGPSGCGKSTLLAILGLMDGFTSGSYRLAGLDVSSLSGSERSRVRNRDIGYVFQNFNLIGDLTVTENVGLPLKYRGAKKNERLDRVDAALKRVGMTHRAGHFPTQLSGGQQQRVAVARAIASEPAVLLADEPTGNLDSKNGSAVMELLSDLHESGATIVMVTHDTSFNKHAQRIISLFDGRVVA